MILICFVDDNMGMSFNGRRQSRDAVAISDLISIVGNGRLFVDRYTEALLKPVSRSAGTDMVVVEHPLEAAGAGDYTICEREDPKPYTAKIEKIILYHWNRVYPADTYFSINPDYWSINWKRSLIGNSHEKIDIEEWDIR